MLALSSDRELPALCTMILEKAVVATLRNFPDLYGNRKFIVLFTGRCAVLTTRLHTPGFFSEMFNIILAPMYEFASWPLPFRKI
jgi:hypothetical protein